MLKIKVRQQPNGTYRILPGHPAFGAAQALTIYTALNVAKSYLREYPHIFDGITVESLVDSSL